ncbi:putative glycerophosphodiester phosphodiesterase GDE1 [Rosellinia necatrix]|uniref:Putative glycerophosphodiester phosphodiesterase GDE1 n=1 Tax=Rosellinia necatrix TaxID=77044 RepID=A0A1W2TK50_ROSNE|nr:putative glycerophosphodiester phosphodiesterase GDE1 [Rosellinia necatrix]
MKFGRNLPRNQVPQWASAYINYKGLKRLIKAAAQTAKAGKEVDIAEFLFALDRNLEDVDSFYNKKFAEVHRRLKLLQDRYGRSLDVVTDLDDQESEELISILLEMRNQLRNLQWFGEINRRGFVKITKKLDKKVPQATTTTQDQYMTTMVDPKPFAKDITVARLINEINKWLSILGDAQNFDDARSDKSSRSVRSLGRVTAKALPTVPQAVLDALDTAIRNDDASGLQTSLSEQNFAASTQASQAMLFNLLQRSISSGSKACIAYILPQLDSLYEPDDLNERNCIHRLVIYIGRAKSASVAGDLEPNATGLHLRSHYNDHYITPAQVPSSKTSSVSGDPTALSLLNKDDESVQLLSYILDRLQPQQRSALSSKDAQNRVPLHYAAQCGFVVLCEIIMAKMQEWGQFDVTDGFDAPEWQDKEGNAPLHLAVIGGHPLTTKCLLKGENWQGPDHIHRKPVPQSSAVLAIATRAGFVGIVKMLVEAGVDINWQDATGETALHIAARFGHVECARVLIEGSSDQKADLELTENSFAWNALHIAAVDGHLLVAQLLVDAGINVSKPDSFGWTAKEHAALRGHLEVADLLAPCTTLPPVSPKTNAVGDGEAPPMSSSPPTEISSLGDRKSNGSNRVTDPVKSFGHRYLKDECLVMVSLGSMDMRKDFEPVKLDRVPLAEAHTNQLDTALSVVISAQGAHGEPTTIELPVHDNISTEPILFYTSDASKVKMLFDIVPTYSGNEKHKIGRAVALLSSVRPTLGTSRMNLQGDVCVPIMSSNLEVIGAVNFNFLVITPFTHPNMEINSQQTYWKKLASTMLIGHRGLGKNFLANKSLQLGENTVSSFIAAANLGAQYVEFDVQLTKDHVPVIYHDFLVSETGIDAPVHTLTLEQFLHINDGTNRGSRRNSVSRRQPLSDGASNGVAGPKPRSLSVDLSAKSKDTSLEERMKYTLNYKKTGYKANTRGNFVQQPFATLEELFKKVPETVGFNIEMKYPMLLESEQHYMDTYAIELNSFCDTVLTKVYELAGNRHIIFSSFNPDICLCLNFKQPSIPIMFLTDAGIGEVSDIRASSLQEAIRFASRWNLLGIVSNATPFVNSPRLVKVVKQSGLVCVSYGVQNNDPELVQLQVNEGIDAVIVDSVLAIRQGLTRES